MSKIKLACGEVWPSRSGCTAWGSRSSHGCRLDPGHDGIHRCLCGRPKPESDRYPSVTDEPCECCEREVLTRLRHDFDDPDVIVALCDECSAVLEHRVGYPSVTTDDGKIAP